MEKGQPLVSIIVPTYNVEKYCRTCFDSLINQTLDNIEIILIDDGSTDTSGAICDEYAEKDSRIKVIHQANRGLGLSRNSGLEEACGEYVGFVDSDDCVSKDMFRTLYENARRFESDISYCNYIKFVDEDELPQACFSENKTKCLEGERNIQQYMLDRVGLPPENKEDGRFGASVCCGIFMLKKLRELGVCFVSEREFIAEDMIFDIDVIPHCERIVHSNAELYYYRYNPQSLTTVYKEDRFEKNVKLYHAMYDRLVASGYAEEELFNPMSRYLLTTSRIAIIQEAKFVKENGRKKAISNIKNICKKDEVLIVLDKYRYKLLPMKYRITCFLMKMKWAQSLLIIYQLHQRIKYSLL